MRLGVSAWFQISNAAMPPRAKSIANYHNGRLALLDAEAVGYCYPMFLTQSGKAFETAGSCFFVVRDGTIITPDVSSDILVSITRDTVNWPAREKLGYQVVERPVDRSEIYIAEEAFITGAHHEVRPVISLDSLSIGRETAGSRIRKPKRGYVILVESRDECRPDCRTTRKPG